MKTADQNMASLKIINQKMFPQKNSESEAVFHKTANQSFLKS
jgi:hypothetical protein